MSEDEARERRAEEYVKLCFELFKHLTTLSTAGALVAMAVYREVSAGTGLLALTLALFGVTILAAVMGMIAAIGYFAPSPHRPTRGLLLVFMFVVSISFVLAVANFMFGLVDIQMPWWVRIIAIVVDASLLVFLAWRMLQSLILRLRGEDQSGQADPD